MTGIGFYLKQKYHFFLELVSQEWEHHNLEILNMRYSNTCEIFLKFNFQKTDLGSGEKASEGQ